MKYSGICKVGLGASALLLACSTQLTYADDDTGGYIGIGVSRLDANFKGVNDEEFDDSDDSLQIKLGYMFNDVWGAEFGYNNLGSYTGGSDLQIDADGYWLAGVANWGFAENWDLYGKLGASIIDSTSDQTIPGGGAFKENETETNVFGAVGIELDLGVLNLYGEYAAIDTKVSDLTVDVLSLGIKFEFQ